MSAFPGFKLEYCGLKHEFYIYKHRLYVIISAYRNRAEEPALYFWRDQHGHEIDTVIDLSTHLYPVEIKSGSTFREEWLKTLNWFNNLQGYSSSRLVYGGDESFLFKNCTVRSWKELDVDEVMSLTPS